MEARVRLPLGWGKARSPADAVASRRPGAYGGGGRARGREVRRRVYLDMAVIRPAYITAAGATLLARAYLDMATCVASAPCLRQSFAVCSPPVRSPIDELAAAVKAVLTPKR